MLFLIDTSFASCKFKFIHNASELIEFSDNVNSYLGYTVYLVADIEFNATLTQQYKPIQNFIGTFDGQGYVIRSLVINTGSFQQVGLFGFSGGITIKNVIIDDSCSFTNSYSNSVYAHLGGLIAYFSAGYGHSSIENSVNMASVTYNGWLYTSSSGSGLYIGGISGAVTFPYNYYGSLIVNCVNYGTILKSGSVQSHASVGGIVGEAYTIVGNNIDYIFNCINYGIVKIPLMQMAVILVEFLVLALGHISQIA